MHGTRAGHATGYVKGQQPTPRPVEAPVVSDPDLFTEAEVQAAEGELPPPSPDAVVADVLAYWAEMDDLAPIDRVRKIGQLCDVTSSEVRRIIHEHEATRKVA